MNDSIEPEGFKESVRFRLREIRKELSLIHKDMKGSIESRRKELVKRLIELQLELEFMDKKLMDAMKKEKDIKNKS